MHTYIDRKLRKMNKWQNSNFHYIPNKETMERCDVTWTSH